MAAFVPPIFGNLGKSATDVLKKKFDDKKDFVYTAKSVTVDKTTTGLTWTFGAQADPKGVTNIGTLKAKYAKDTFGEVTGELSTAGPAKVELKLKKLAKGLTVTLVEDTAPAYAPAPKAGAKPAKFTGPTVKATAEYSQDFFSGVASAETAFTKTNILTGSAVIGFEGLSVGGEVKVDTAAFTDVEDYNVGAQYEAKDFTATLKTANQGEDLNVSVLVKPRADLQLATNFAQKLDGSDDRSMALASEWKQSADTTIKLRGDTKKVVAIALERRIAEPRVQVGIASSYNVPSVTSAPVWKDFGVSLVFGDYEADK